MPCRNAPQCTCPALLSCPFPFCTALRSMHGALHRAVLPGVLPCAPHCCTLAAPRPLCGAIPCCATPGSLCGIGPPPTALHSDVCSLPTRRCAGSSGSHMHVPTLLRNAAPVRDVTIAHRRYPRSSHNCCCFHRCSMLGQLPLLPDLKHRQAGPTAVLPGRSPLLYCQAGPNCCTARQVHTAVLPGRSPLLYCLAGPHCCTARQVPAAVLPGSPSLPPMA
jgi:hypothetical protein